MLMDVARNNDALSDVQINAPSPRHAIVDNDQSNIFIGQAFGLDLGLEVSTEHPLFQVEAEAGALPDPTGKSAAPIT